jgi:hypothetical protein
MHADDHAKSHDHDHDYDHQTMIAKWIWRDYINITLGVWLIASPPTLGYNSAAMMWNDIISGVLIIALTTAALVGGPRLDMLRWGVCFVGMWLLFAPLVLWTPDAAAYANDNLVGALVIAFSVLIPMMPGRAHHQAMMLPGPVNPPGWSYNPSDWVQRGPIIAMAFVGFFLSRYLAAYQLGHVAQPSHPWDPFFGNGTRRVLESDVSKMWPISDAGLGAVSYMLEALSGFMGGVTRWRTMPWMVVMFGVLVIPLGIVSIVLVVLQPVAVGAWCTLCLITAGAMLIMIAPAIDEVVAMCQFLIAAKREGQPLWRVFWVGGTLQGDRCQVTGDRDKATGNDAATNDSESHEQRALTPDTRHLTPTRLLTALDLNNVPWNMLLSAALGVWLMFAPSVLGVEGGPGMDAADSDHLLGALVVTFSVIAFGEVARPIRLLNIPLGLMLALAPWIVAGDTALSRWNDVAVGMALIALSLRRGRIEERFGAWNRYLI